MLITKKANQLNIGDVVFIRSKSYLVGSSCVTGYTYLVDLDRGTVMTSTREEFLTLATKRIRTEDLETRHRVLVEGEEYHLLAPGATVLTHHRSGKAYHPGSEVVVIIEE